MTFRAQVPYQHNPEDLRGIDLAVTGGAAPRPQDWQPALRDIVDGTYVIRADFPTAGTIWIRDHQGVRRADGQDQQQGGAAPGSVSFGG